MLTNIKYLARIHLIASIIFMLIGLVVLVTTNLVDPFACKEISSETAINTSQRCFQAFEVKMITRHKQIPQKIKTYLQNYLNMYKFLFVEAFILFAIYFWFWKVLKFFLKINSLKLKEIIQKSDENFLALLNKLLENSSKIFRVRLAFILGCIALVLGVQFVVSYYLTNEVFSRDYLTSTNHLKILCSLSTNPVPAPDQEGYISTQVTTMCDLNLSKFFSFLYKCIWCICTVLFVVDSLFLMSLSLTAVLKGRRVKIVCRLLPSVNIHLSKRISNFLELVLILDSLKEEISLDDIFSDKLLVEEKDTNDSLSEACI